MLPKPIPGCVRTSGLAGQQGITWPTYFKWELRNVDGKWMVDQMVPEQPPIDVENIPNEKVLVSSEDWNLDPAGDSDSAPVSRVMGCSL